MTEGRRPTEPKPEVPRHELSNVTLRALLISVAIGFAFVILSLLFLWGLFWGLESLYVRYVQPEPMSLVKSPTVYPEPYILALPDELERLHEIENKMLTNYAWISRQQGIVQIPVDRAMELVASRGLPAWTEETTFR